MPLLTPSSPRLWAAHAAPSSSSARTDLPSAALADIQASVDAITKSAHDIGAMVHRIDTDLRLIDRVLRIAQPPVAGKLGVRFWRLRAGSSPTPVLITWRRVSNRHWRAQRVHRLDVRNLFHAGNAGICVSNAYHLAQIAVRLIRHRSFLVDRLARLRRHATAVGKSFGPMEHAEALTAAEHAAVIQRLEEAGYSVDDDARGLIDQYLQ